MRSFVTLLLTAAFIGVPEIATTQQADVDSALVRSLTNEILSLLPAPPTGDSASRAILVEAANLQLGFEDFDGFLNSARLIRQMPNSRSQYRQMSRNLVCYLLEDRKIDAARGYAFALADGHSEEDDWTRTHLAMHFLYLPNPVRKSMKAGVVDSAALRRDAFAIARSLRTPEVVTDTYLALGNFLIRAKDLAGAHTTLLTADSARHFITNTDRARSRAAFVARQASTLGDWTLANRAVGEFSNWMDFESLAERIASSKPGSGESPELISFNRRILAQYIDLLKGHRDQRVRDHAFSNLRVRLEYSGRKALADSLLPAVKDKKPETPNRAEEQPYDSLMIRAIESVRNRNIAEAERSLRAIADPEHTGLAARAMINLAWNFVHPDDAQAIRKRGLAMLLEDSKLRSRDSLLSEVARERALYGDNEMAVDIVNAMHDVAIARATLANIGESTMANLDAAKLRKLVDRIRAKEVKEQVLLRLMTSMLLTRFATHEQNEWGLALADSIRTPGLRGRARLESAKFRWAHGDSVRALTLLREVLHDKVEEQNEYDRYADFSLLIAAGGRADLIAWARSKRDPIERARALFQVIYPIRNGLPRGPDSRQAIFSNGGDGCRADF